MQTLDAIIVYEKETGNIQSLTPGFDIDYFLKTQTDEVTSLAPVFNSEGVEIGTRQVPLYDPIIKSNVRVLKTLDSNLDVAVLTTRTREEILEVTVPDYEYFATPYNVIDKDGNVSRSVNLWMPPEPKKLKTGINAQGEMTVEAVTKKALAGYEHITILTQAEQNFNFSEHEEVVDELIIRNDDGEEINRSEKKELNLSKVFFDLHENYTVVNNSLVKKSTPE